MRISNAYEIVTDYETFEFYELSHEGKWYMMQLSTMSSTMQRITDLIAEFAVKAATHRLYILGCK